MNMNGQNTIINIGRQFGSGGKLIALKISETLGVPVYDNELISKAADESGFSKELFERSDEKRSIFNISSFFGTGRFGGTQTTSVTMSFSKSRARSSGTSRRKVRRFS